MEPLMVFTSHIDGRNATVRVFQDRLEWTRPGRHTVVNVLLIVLAVYTAAISLIFKACRPRFRGETQMLAVRALAGVTTSPAGPLTTNVIVSAGANLMTFTVRNDVAPGVRQCLSTLAVGSHPAQTL